ncbi:chromate efflux transporter [Hoeflea prorocentri]|uniref:Chromate efflux transporter n=1 Tax=Hoeflea prorocentri TaxID=1922333 RepID=A0A9X3UHR1_9HYPH|nr:chromate efflux transporter [Hoeflea prorocentri]MCY6381068.1 chromate efflux transporter [Hoeflea prorocentri]MDA5398868.1 chromate efflux transporter [Hoeflea prorocentri]
MSAPKPIEAEEPATARLPELIAAFWRIGILSFGGPAAQIALMHRVLVEEKRWLAEKQYLNALSFCMLLPGPEAMQLATYAGWRLQGVAGGLIAGLLFVLPGAAVMLGLAVLYAYLGSVPLVSALFLGIKAAVLVIVIEALLRVAKRALHQSRHWAIAALAFIGIFFLNLPFPLIILAAALIGFLGGMPKGDVQEPVVRQTSLAKTVQTIALWLAIWWLPLLAITALGPSFLAELGFFFSKLAVVTFGGAYAVLAYMAQDVVSHHGWLSAGAMMDGLGLAETTPGPLILVTEFVGFLSAFGKGGLILGIAGALVTLWATFAPCFLWIFAGAPYIDWIGAQPRLRGALAAITAAVVGVILNLSIWFALHVAFTTVDARSYGPIMVWQPDPATLDWRVVLLTLISGILLLVLKWGMLRVLAVSALLGLLLSYAGSLTL